MNPRRLIAQYVNYIEVVKDITNDYAYGLVSKTAFGQMLNYLKNDEEISKIKVMDLKNGQKATVGQLADAIVKKVKKGKIAPFNLRSNNSAVMQSAARRMLEFHGFSWKKTMNKWEKQLKDGKLPRNMYKALLRELGYLMYSRDSVIEDRAEAIKEIDKKLKELGVN